MTATARNERTMRAYSQDLEDFRAFVGALDVHAAAGAPREALPCARRRPWALEVRNAKAQPYRDTRGPGRDGSRSALGEARRPRRPQGLPGPESFAVTATFTSPSPSTPTSTSTGLTEGRPSSTYPRTI
jgi:hypothetical protein